jgi:hypothetical protein
MRKSVFPVAADRYAARNGMRSRNGICFRSCFPFQMIAFRSGGDFPRPAAAATGNQDARR